MRLKQWPRTELEYWSAFDQITSMLNILGDSDDINITRDANDLKTTRTRLISEIAQKFNVIPPSKGTPPASQVVPGAYPDKPGDKRWFWEWYKSIKHNKYLECFNNLLCPKCPYFTGSLVEFIESKKIPCSLHNFDIVTNECVVCNVLVVESEFLAKLIEEHGIDKFKHWVDTRNTLREDTMGRQCEACGKNIPKLRLTVLPNTTLCVRCADKVEKTEGIKISVVVDEYDSRDLADSVGASED